MLSPIQKIRVSPSLSLSLSLYLSLFPQKIPYTMRAYRLLCAIFLYEHPISKYTTQARIQKIFPGGGGGPTLSSYHLITSYLILILWIDSV